MMYESRRILLGFRIKLNFDISLGKKNSYIYVNLTKTPTIKDLLFTIRERFDISQDVYITLNDCHILDSEDNAVLIDVDEVRIVPRENEANIALSKSSQLPLALGRDHLSECDTSQQSDAKYKWNGEVSKKKDQHPMPVVQPSNNEKPCISHDDDVSPANGTSYRKGRRFYSSIAETIKYLHQNYKPVSECSSVLSNNLTSSENDGGCENKSSGVKEQESVANSVKLDCQNDATFEEISDNHADKRKRRRKRKHSKKPKLTDQNEIPRDYLHVYSNMEVDTVDSSSSKSTRQHIFFEADDDLDVQEVNDANECNSWSNAVESTPLRDTNLQKFANNRKKVETYTTDTNDVADVTDGRRFKINDSENYEKKPVARELMCERSATPFAQISTRKISTPRVESTNAKYSTACERSIHGEATLPSNIGFFKAFSSITNDRSILQKKEVTPQAHNPLATLLMCKQLQTPVEYNVQFTNANNVSHVSNNINKSQSSNRSRASSSVISQTSASRLDNDDYENECEVLCHYKIVGDKISLRDSNGVWKTLSAEETSLLLPPVEEPRENHSITFQMLYLGANMCPTMSDLICGKVISFQKDSGRLILNILPAFIDNLVKNREDACLPEELVHVTDNVYQIPWLAVKNPRLLM